MGIPTTTAVTYQAVIDQVKSYITSNCKNITDYAGMSTWAKAGTYTVASTYAAAHDQNQFCATFTITVSGGVGSSTASQVNSDITNYFTNYYLPTNTWSYPIDNKNLYKFLYNIAIFYSYNVCWLAYSNLAQRGTIYGTSGNTSNLTWYAPSTATPSAGRYLVYASSVPTTGYTLDPQPANTESTPTTSNGIVTGATRDFTMNMSVIQNVVAAILANRTARKTISLAYTGSVS